MPELSEPREPSTPVDLADRLAPWTAELLAQRLGLRPDDAADTAALVREVLADGELLAAVGRFTAGLQQVVGAADPFAREVFGSRPEEVAVDSRALGQRVQGGLALVALLAAVPDVLTYHERHHIDAAQSWRTLSDLGQQVWVHRRTFGEFGIHTHGWLACAWSGALHWLGRLQFNLMVRPAESGDQHPDAATRWQLSTHIPESGPLTPAAVEDSIVRAVAFFAEHHPGQPVERLHCSSWLLDPTLAAELPGTNLAHFQQRWTLTGRAHPGTEDALFFTFRRRGEVDPDTLPTDSRLQRLVVERVRSGAGWQTTEGIAPLPAEPQATTTDPTTTDPTTTESERR